MIPMRRVFGWIQKSPGSHKRDEPKHKRPAAHAVTQYIGSPFAGCHWPLVLLVPIYENTHLRYIVEHKLKKPEQFKLGLMARFQLSKIEPIGPMTYRFRRNRSIRDIAASLVLVNSNANPLPVFDVFIMLYLL